MDWMVSDHLCHFWTEFVVLTDAFAGKPAPTEFFGEHTIVF